MTARSGFYELLDSSNMVFARAAQRIISMRTNIPSLQILQTMSDVSELRETFNKNGRVRVPDVLEPALAEQAAEELRGKLPWELAIHTPQGPAVIEHKRFANANTQQKLGLQQHVIAQARRGFAFIYGRLDLIPGETEWLQTLREALASPEFLQLLVSLTGDASLTRVDAQATVYEPGCFLKTHDDTYKGKQRKIAYVLGFTKRWQADWGGLLHFQDTEGKIIDTHIPGFNTLSVFKVPASHFVSAVAQYAPEKRYAISGWGFADE